MRPAFALSLLLLCASLASAHFLGTDGTAAQLLTPVELAPNASVPIVFLFTDPRSGVPLTQLDTIHERSLHVYVAGQGLTWFVHTHPEDFSNGLAYANEGQRHVFITFPAPGTYAIAIDYAYNGIPTSQLFTVAVPGDAATLPPPDMSRTQRTGAYEVTLHAPERIHAGEAVAFSLSIAKDGAPVTDLQQFLGADMHGLLINAALNRSAHVHPYVSGHGTHLGSMPQRYTGPNVPFQETFPEPGIYAFFAQFQHEGKIMPVVFHLAVEPRPAVPWRAIAIGAWALAALLVGVAAWRFWRR